MNVPSVVWPVELLKHRFVYARIGDGDYLRFGKSPSYHSDVLASLLGEFGITPELFEIQRFVETIQIPKTKGVGYEVMGMGICVAFPDKRLIRLAKYRPSADYKMCYDLDVLRAFEADGWHFEESISQSLSSRRIHF